MKPLYLLVLLFVLAACQSEKTRRLLTPQDSTQTQTEATDFRAVSLQGETITLASFPGRYVVLDFWGTWCPWCVKGIPEMRKYYAKYADRMEIVGVDTGDDETDLRDFVKEHEMDWTHVINDEDDADGSLTALYHVESFPTKIIIDPEGYIVDTFVGESPAFYQRLDELFK